MKVMHHINGDPTDNSPENLTLVDMPGKLSLAHWLRERLDNCQAIAAKKIGADRDGWLKDAAYFAKALAALSPSPYPPYVVELAEAEAHAERLLFVVKALNTALDAYWNLEPNKPTRGVINAVVAAQQACKVAIDKGEAWK